MAMNFLFRRNSEKSAAEEKRELELELANQANVVRRAKAQIDELNRAWQSAESRLEAATDRFRRVSDQNASLVRQHAHDVKALKTEHATSMSDSEQKHNHTIGSLKRESTLKIQKIETDHRKEVEKLVGQLLVNQDSNRGWPDDKLKHKFQELQQLIDSVTSPHNREFAIPQDQQLGLHLDPTNFIGRIGRDRSHFLLRSIIWSILHERFFSAPVGFGALGPDEGHRELLNVFSTWRKLFDEYTKTVSPCTDELAIFQQDGLANKWRSASFQCINAALAATAESHPSSISLVAKLSADNIQQTVYLITSVLSEVLSLSNSHMRSEMPDQIRRMANISHEIALQFGVHHAQLHLSTPRRGDQVQIGEAFQDCEDGDCYKGSFNVVDLVVVPGLQRIGDGRSDMSSKRNILPCEFYPDEVGGAP